mgnify:FL=1
MVGGLQRITTFEGHVIPLSFNNGLPRLSIRPYTNDEWDVLPHVFMTSPGEWNPSVLDSPNEKKVDWFDTNVEPPDNREIAHEYDEFGDFRQRVFSEVRPVDTRKYADMASYSMSIVGNESTLYDGDEYFIAETHHNRVGEEIVQADKMLLMVNVPNSPTVLSPTDTEKRADPPEME